MKQLIITSLGVLAMFGFMLLFLYMALGAWEQEDKARIQSYKIYQEK